MTARGTRVLIVDDDVDLADNLAELLLDRGCDVSLAEDGQEALERACAQEFDIIFMDVRMPVMNGVDSFFAIRSIKPQARIVMMTGYKEKFVEGAIQAGAEGPLYKPFAIGEVLALIESRSRFEQLLQPGRPDTHRGYSPRSRHGSSGTIH